MIKTSGWSLAGRLALKHFGTLGERIATAVAEFDPETATEADREQLQVTLRESASKLAAARDAATKEEADVTRLQELLRTDGLAVDVLLQRLSKGEISEAAVNTFCDELEANRARLPQEEQEAEDAKAFVGELEELVKQLSKQLQEFDAVAKKAMRDLASAEAQQDIQELRVRRQAELSGLRGVANSSSALAALTRRAAKVKADAEGLRLVADVQDQPEKDQKAIDEIRRSVAGGATQSETAAERLQRLAGAGRLAA